MKRSSGILLPIFSLPSKYGIGCFSLEAYNFIDFLSKSGQSYWQILPLVPAGECESPYSSPSTFAGNPLFIDLEQLIIMQLLTREEVEFYEWDNSNIIDYPIVTSNKMKLLYKAYMRSNHFNDPNFIKFCIDNAYWLEEYCDYMEIAEGNSVDYYKFEQFIFDLQWRKVKEYANYKGIKIIGDLPLYVSLNSADVYNNPDIFELDLDIVPNNVAGCPPDMSSPNGQVWGNPLYDWDYLKETEYDWWVKRMRRCADLHDVVRLDHFRGFYDYYSIPANTMDAKNGEWKLGPAMDLFKLLEEKIPNLDFIAEDLGFLSPGVHQLMKDTGYPGMKILQFAFNSGKDNPYLPENISENYVVYTGTHDNNTTLGWYKNASEWEKEHLKQYIPNIIDVCWDLIELAMSTKANLCIIQMQDYLGLDADCRTNTPGTINKNWKWRMTEEPTEDLAKRIKYLTKKYNR